MFVFISIGFFGLALSTRVGKGTSVKEMKIKHRCKRVIKRNSLLLQFFMIFFMEGLFDIAKCTYCYQLGLFLLDVLFSVFLI